MTVQFLVKIVSFHFKVTQSQRDGIKSEKRTSGIFSLSSFALVLVDWGHNFHFSKSQKKFRPADRNGELAKPNMYFAAALITFAAKTPTANERRPTRSRRKTRKLVPPHSRFRPCAIFLFFSFFFRKCRFMSLYVQVHLCTLPSERRCDPNVKRTVRSF